MIKQILHTMLYDYNTVHKLSQSNRTFEALIEIQNQTGLDIYNAKLVLEAINSTENKSKEN